MNEIPEFDKVRTYTVMQAVCFDKGRGFVLGANTNPGAIYPYATWYFKEKNKRRTFTDGNFYLTNDANVAVRSFTDRVNKYKLENPYAIVRYNYLASVEMGEEENYNQIDGIINNTKKPSILEHLQQFKPQPCERGDKPEKSAEREK